MCKNLQYHFLFFPKSKLSTPKSEEIPCSHTPNITVHTFQILQSHIYITFFCVIIPVKRITAQKTKEGILLKKADFIKAVAKQAGTSQKEADAILTAALGAIKDALKKDDSVAFLKFGTFKISKRAARKGRNPQTGKEIQIPATKLPVFKASAAFKEFVNGKKAAKKKK